MTKNVKIGNISMPVLQMKKGGPANERAVQKRKKWNVCRIEREQVLCAQKSEGLSGKESSRKKKGL